uniref:Uncharacterized protein n=1 Tax=Caenorhabditis japonica TaxID=281687 RepID=A0A8R1EC45_CAEJA
MMPERTQLFESVKAMKKKLQKNGSKKTWEEVPEASRPSEPTSMFKANGEPIWVVPECKPGEGEKTEDGDEILNPELATALAECDMQIEEKAWADVVTDFIMEKLTSGPILKRSEQCLLDPYLDMEELVKNDKYLNQDGVTYLTARSLYSMSMQAVRRFEKKRNGRQNQEEKSRPRPYRAPSAEQGKRMNEESAKTAEGPESRVIKFDLEQTRFFSYERQTPFGTIREVGNQNTLVPVQNVPTRIPTSDKRLAGK